LLIFKRAYDTQTALPSGVQGLGSLINKRTTKSEETIEDVILETVILEMQ